ncbi:hypothetical protein ACFQ1L_01315 [Phytohabitans flavus]|uniref:hypothetical protein n=1 Tax=Phytohabitans flavus TaxID=1076124 RepID=UPI0015651C97|nr:hypothetical protein [Phytohabitans flavus]
MSASDRLDDWPASPRQAADRAFAALTVDPGTTDPDPRLCRHPRRRRRIRHIPRRHCRHNAARTGWQCRHTEGCRP